MADPLNVFTGGQFGIVPKPDLAVISDGWFDDVLEWINAECHTLGMVRVLQKKVKIVRVQEHSLCHGKECCEL